MTVKRLPNPTVFTGKEREYLNELVKSLNAGLSELSKPDYGRYDPTVTNTANLDSSACTALRWMKVGKMVHVFGELTVDPTAGATLTTLRLSLPFASVFSNTKELVGHITDVVGSIEAATANEEALVSFTSAGTGSATYGISFYYEILGY